MDEREKHLKRKALMDRLKALTNLTREPTYEELKSLSEEARSIDAPIKQHKRRSLI